MHNASDLNNIIQFKNVSKHFTKQDIALSDVSFSITKGEFAALIGASGSGKSTILRIIASLETADSGTVVKPDNVALSFQGAALYPWLTVFRNIAFGLESNGSSTKYVTDQVEKYARLLGLTEHLHKLPSELSGGQKQRVGIARALAVEPAVLLLDEPFSALDPKTTAELHDDIVKLWKETGKTIVMVSHVIEEAVSLAEKVILVKDHHVATVFDITLPYPRREQGVEFHHTVMKVREQFFN